MSDAVKKRPGARAIAATALAGGLAAGLAVQRRHLQGLARDDDYARLTAPLGGRPLEVTSADGTELYAEQFGPAGAPTIVLAHGWTERLGFWGPVIRRLEAGGLRVVAYDLRGHGDSDKAAGHDYSLERFGEDLEAVLAASARDETGGGPHIVAGHSLGAMSIAAWAEHHDPRERANAAALINTGLGDLLDGHLLLGDLAHWLNHPRTSRAVMCARLRVPPFSSPAQQAMLRYIAFGPDATAGDVAFYERMLIDTDAGVRAACGVALCDMDLWHTLERLTIPTLVIAGERDRLTPPVHARRIAGELPEPAGLLELPGSGHMSPLERPREVADALLRLTERVTVAPDAAGGRA